MFMGISNLHSSFQKYFLVPVGMHVKVVVSCNCRKDEDEGNSLEHVVVSLAF